MSVMREICRNGGTAMTELHQHLSGAVKRVWVGTTNPSDRIAGILEVAEGEPLAECKAAVDHLKGEINFFPKPAEFKKALRRKSSNDNGVNKSQKELFDEVMARKVILMRQHSKSLTAYLDSFSDYGQAIKASQLIGLAVNEPSRRANCRHFQAWEQMGGVVVEDVINQEFPLRPWAKQNRKKASGQ